MSKSVAVAMIVKNEEVLLSRCLDSVKGLPIYILDTGSQDRTLEIARRYTDNVFLDYIWIDNFSDAQNVIKSRVKEDWVLSLDADEQLLSSIEEVMAAAEKGEHMVRVSMIPETISGQPEGESFGFGRLFRNSPEIYWQQAIHKHLNIPGSGEPVGNIRIMYGRSPAHDLDPDRSLRMLEQTVAQEKNPIRNLYYLGREYYYKKRYQEAIDTFKRYFPVAHWDAELADAYLITAQSYLEIAGTVKDNQALIETAAETLFQAIKVNANFKEAIQLMADMAVKENKMQWQRMARAANNEDILFQRIPTERVDDVILIAPHNDDESLFAAYTCMRVKPLVIVVTDSFIQPERGDKGCDAQTRRQETIEAMKIAGCPVVFLGIKDTELTEEILRERLKAFNPARVYAPAIQGGNRHHDMVGKVAKEFFSDRCEQYTTYTKTELYTTGKFEIKPTDEEKALKRKMLDCYKSQIDLSSTSPHFTAVVNKSEWLL